MSLVSLCTTHTITVERSPSSRDSSGAPKYQEWAAISGLSDLFASVQPMSSSERMLFAQRNLVLTHKVYLPGNYTTLIKKQDRVKDVNSGKIYTISGIFDVAGRGELTMLEVREMQ